MKYLSQFLFEQGLRILDGENGLLRVRQLRPEVGDVGFQSGYLVVFPDDGDVVDPLVDGLTVDRRTRGHRGRVPPALGTTLAHSYRPRGLDRTGCRDRTLEHLFSSLHVPRPRDRPGLTTNSILFTLLVVKNNHWIA